MKKSNVKQDFIIPIVVLALICLVISGALALTNMVTAPIIEQAAAERADIARKEVLPDADSFTALVTDNMPATIKEAYRADNGVGYVFFVNATGYGGEIQIICGIDSNGLITASRILEHAETQGMGSKAAEEPFASQFVGKDASLSGVEAISGATVTSKAYINAIKDVFAAYEIGKGA